MKKDDGRRMTGDLLAMALAVVVGLIFTIVNLIITQSVLTAWTEMVFHSSCPIGVLFNFSLGNLPYIHAFLIGLPLTALSGCVTAILATRQIRRTGDAIIFGSTTGIVSALMPYGSAWALYALFAIYWVEQPLLIAYLGMILLGIAVSVPPAVLGAYYCSRKKFSTSPAGIPYITLLKIPLIVTLVMALAIVLPLAVALAGVRLGWVV